MTVIGRWAKPEVGGCRLAAAAVPDANFPPRKIDLHVTVGGAIVVVLNSSLEVFSGAKAKTPDANLGRVQDGSPDKIPRSNLACTYPIHLSHSGSVWPISYSTHFPAAPGWP